MVSWVFWFAVILAPSLIGLTFAVRAARRVTRAERALRALAARPGWRLLERGDDGAEWAGYAGHFPWLLSARPRTTVTGPVGERQVTIGRLVKSVSRRVDAHWLVLCFDLPAAGPGVRLERHWSAAHLNLRFPEDLPYLPVSDHVAQTAARLEATDLTDRLLRLAAPAVSLAGDQACFVYFPLPEVLDMDALLAGLAGLLPDLVALARDTAPEDAPGNGTGRP
ncbi:hypothetical protein ACH4UM_18525 [Streptomyces sp. NPDC020801]|uniref:hypothetical protein n=1 Tax=unclassified Streptomyces TaxID=2593676 RepID=UPI0037AF62E7